MTESLWRNGGCRQDGIDTMAVYETEELGESSSLERGDVESLVGRGLDGGDPR